MADTNPIEARIRESVERIAPGSFEKLNHIHEQSTQDGERIFSELLGYACCAQNVGVITTARKALGRLPNGWFLDHLDNAVKDAINLKDEWEYLRLLEVLKLHAPAKLKDYVTMGLTSANEEVREAATDFKEYIV